MTDKEKEINKELTELLRIIQSMKIDFNLALPTLQNKRQNAIDKIISIKHILKEGK
jgi:hypothetical protein